MWCEGHIEAALSQEELQNTDYMAKYLIAAPEVSQRS